MNDLRIPAPPPEESTFMRVWRIANLILRTVAILFLLWGSATAALNEDWSKASVYLLMIVVLLLVGRDT